MSENNTDLIGYTAKIVNGFSHLGDWAVKTEDERLSLSALALVGESGELANKVKKHLGYRRLPTEEIRAEVLDELSDVMYCVVQTAHSLDISLEEVLTFGLEKQIRRNPANKTTGN